MATQERVIYRFAGGNDGAAPYASMIADARGDLFGTTTLGGGGANCPSGCGTVFELLPQRDGSWTETVIHGFAGGNDGATPQSPMIFDSAGNLYGSTSAGGNGNCGNIGQMGCGTVFELSPPGTSGQQWTESVLYSFQGVPSGKGNGDAAWPNGLAFGGNGNLYGLAYDGGRCRTDESGTYCFGAAFRLEQTSGGTWNERVLYRFDGTTGSPAGPVLDHSGNIYGTAPGGAYGFGAVFVLQSPVHGRSSWIESSIYDF
ncbi:MAG TPA: choice-of-anchor tandem repeat GloVer-containing protein, partial [Rhizomicrobium sp.]